MRRHNDIYFIKTELIDITINNIKHKAAKGESVLSALLAYDYHAISLNDHGKISGAYCCMGVCFCCLVNINGVNKQRACQTTITENMKIKTCDNRIQKEILNADINAA